MKLAIKNGLILEVSTWQLVSKAKVNFEVLSGENEEVNIKKAFILIKIQFGLLQIRVMVMQKRPVICSS
jgi:hypothetical protein